MSVCNTPQNLCCSSQNTSVRWPCSFKGCLSRLSKKIGSIVSEVRFLYWGIAQHVVIDPPLPRHEKTLENPFRDTWTAAFADKMEPKYLYQKGPILSLVVTPNPDAIPIPLKNRLLFLKVLPTNVLAGCRGVVIGLFAGVCSLEFKSLSSSRCFQILTRVTIIALIGGYSLEWLRVSILYVLKKKNKLQLLRSDPAVRIPYQIVYHRLYLFPSLTQNIPLPTLSYGSHAPTVCIPFALLQGHLLPNLTAKEQALLQQINKSFLKIFMLRRPS